jgi:hypothetical protein
MKNRGFTDFEQLEEFVAEARAPYEVLLDLFNKPKEFYIKYPEIGPDEILDVMESFDRIKPLAVKCRLVAFLRLYRHCYQNYVCIESTVLSLLYNMELEVSDIVRLKQIKERERAELANPFNSNKLKEKRSKAVAKEEPKWNPCIPVYSSAYESSTASLALQKGKLSRSAPAGVLVAPKESVPSPQQESLPPPLQKVMDPKLQKPVDPKIIVSKNAKGQLVHQHHPAKAAVNPSKHKVHFCKPLSACTDTLHMPIPSSQQKSLMQPLELQIVGGKRPLRARPPSASQPEPSKCKKTT